MAIQSNNANGPNIGDRIECNGDFGTIKYIGSVQDHPASWFGIDWDDPNRGRHNGTINDHVYFVATHPKSGSFVRPEKVHRGQSVVKAITSRYGKKDDEYTNKINQQQLLKVQQEINAPFLQLVGFEHIIEKQSDFNNLKVVNLRLQNVNGPGDPKELKILCPNIQELDLSKNLLSSWTSIFGICSQLENLKWLNVSENKLELRKDYTNYCFPNLRILTCGSMQLSWNDILKLSYVFPKMEELRAPSNNIRHLDTPIDNNFRDLKILDLESNAIEEWEEIVKLSTIKSLEYLIIEQTGIKEIRFKECKNQELDNFVHLRRLVITNNKINDWTSVSELNKLKNLEDLRFLGNPVLETEKEGIRNQIIIAKIANLKILNGSEITPTERRGAEYDYLKKYGLEWLSVKDDDQKQKEFLKKHNRYLELVQKYGEMEANELRYVPNTLKKSLLSVTIECGSRTVIKNLPPSILVQKLKTLVQKLFSLSDRPILVYTSNNNPEVEVTLDDEMKELGFYSVQEGDKIIVRKT